MKTTNRAELASVYTENDMSTTTSGTLPVSIYTDTYVKTISRNMFSTTDWETNTTVIPSPRSSYNDIKLRNNLKEDELSNGLETNTSISYDQNVNINRKKDSFVNTVRRNTADALKTGLKTESTVNTTFTNIYTGIVMSTNMTPTDSRTTSNRIYIDIDKNKNMENNSLTTDTITDTPVGTTSFSTIPDYDISASIRNGKFKDALKTETTYGTTPSNMFTEIDTLTHMGLDSTTKALQRDTSFVSTLHSVFTTININTNVDEETSTMGWKTDTTFNSTLSPTNIYSDTDVSSTMRNRHSTKSIPRVISDRPSFILTNNTFSSTNPFSTEKIPRFEEEKRKAGLKEGIPKIYAENAMKTSMKNDSLTIDLKPESTVDITSASFSTITDMNTHIQNVSFAAGLTTGDLVNTTPASFITDADMSRNVINDTFTTGLNTVTVGHATSASLYRDIEMKRNISNDFLTNTKETKINSPLLLSLSLFNTSLEHDAMLNVDNVQGNMSHVANNKTYNETDLMAENGRVGNLKYIEAFRKEDGMSSTAPTVIYGYNNEAENPTETIWFGANTTPEVQPMESTSTDIDMKNDKVNANVILSTTPSIVTDKHASVTNNELMQSTEHFYTSSKTVNIDSSTVGTPNTSSRKQTDTTDYYVDIHDASSLVNRKYLKGIFPTLPLLWSTSSKTTQNVRSTLLPLIKLQVSPNLLVDENVQNIPDIQYLTTIPSTFNVQSNTDDDSSSPVSTSTPTVPTKDSRILLQDESLGSREIMSKQSQSPYLEENNIHVSTIPIPHVQNVTQTSITPKLEFLTIQTSSSNPKINRNMIPTLNDLLTTKENELQTALKLFSSRFTKPSSTDSPMEGTGTSFVQNVTEKYDNSTAAYTHLQSEELPSEIYIDKDKSQMDLTYAKPRLFALSNTFDTPTQLTTPINNMQWWVTNNQKGPITSQSNLSANLETLKEFSTQIFAEQTGKETPYFSTKSTSHERKNINSRDFTYNKNITSSTIPFEVKSVNTTGFKNLWKLGEMDWLHKNIVTTSLTSPPSSEMTTNEMVAPIVMDRESTTTYIPYTTYLWSLEDNVPTSVLEDISVTQSYNLLNGKHTAESGNEFILTSSANDSFPFAKDSMLKDELATFNSTYVKALTLLEASSSSSSSPSNLDSSTVEHTFKKSENITALVYFINTTSAASPEVSSQIDTSLPTYLSTYEYWKNGAMDLSAIDRADWTNYSTEATLAYTSNISTPLTSNNITFSGDRQELDYTRPLLETRQTPPHSNNIEFNNNMWYLTTPTVNLSTTTAINIQEWDSTNPVLNESNFLHYSYNKTEDTGNKMLFSNDTGATKYEYADGAIPYTNISGSEIFKYTNDTDTVHYQNISRSEIYEYPIDIGATKYGNINKSDIYEYPYVKGPSQYGNISGSEIYKYHNDTGALHYQNISGNEIYEYPIDTGTTQYGNINGSEIYEYPYVTGPTQFGNFSASEIYELSNDTGTFHYQNISGSEIYEYPIDTGTTQYGNINGSEMYEYPYVKRPSQYGNISRSETGEFSNYTGAVPYRYISSSEIYEYPNHTGAIEYWNISERQIYEFSNDTGAFKYANISGSKIYKFSNDTGTVHYQNISGSDIYGYTNDTGDIKYGNISGSEIYEFSNNTGAILYANISESGIYDFLNDTGIVHYQNMSGSDIQEFTNDRRATKYGNISGSDIFEFWNDTGTVNYQNISGSGIYELSNYTGGEDSIDNEKHNQRQTIGNVLNKVSTFDNSLNEREQVLTTNANVIAHTGWHETSTASVRGYVTEHYLLGNDNELVNSAVETSTTNISGVSKIFNKTVNTGIQYWQSDDAIIGLPLSMAWNAVNIGGWLFIVLEREFLDGEVEVIAVVRAETMTVSYGNSSLFVSQQTVFDEVSATIYLDIRTIKCQDEAVYTLRVYNSTGEVQENHMPLRILREPTSKIVSPKDLFSDENIDAVKCKADLGYPYGKVVMRISYDEGSNFENFFTAKENIDVQLADTCLQTVLVNFTGFFDQPVQKNLTRVQCGVYDTESIRSEEGYIMSEVEAVRIIPGDICDSNSVGLIPHPYEACEFIECPLRVVKPCPVQTCFDPSIRRCT